MIINHSFYVTSSANADEIDLRRSDKSLLAVKQKEIQQKTFDYGTLISMSHYDGPGYVNNLFKKVTTLIFFVKV